MPTFAVELDGQVFRCQLHPAGGGACGEVLFEPPVPRQQQDNMVMELAEEGVFDALSIGPREALARWDAAGRAVSFRE